MARIFMSCPFSWTLCRSIGRRRVNPGVLGGIEANKIQVAGSIDVTFADFNIGPPFTPTIDVRDGGIVEFSLFFEMNSLT